MDIIERVYSVLLVSSSEKLNGSLTELLLQNRFEAPVCVRDTASAGRYLLENNPDIVIINTPLPDDFGTRLAIDTVGRSSAGVLLLVKAEYYSDITAQTMPYGVLTVSKPVSLQIVGQSLQLLCGTRERLRLMEKKTASLEEKMEEIRIVNRAKLILIEQLRMTEAEAHRFIEKQAMDRCVTRRSVAESIISTYK